MATYDEPGGTAKAAVKSGEVPGLLLSVERTDAGFQMSNNIIAESQNSYLVLRRAECRLGDRRWEVIDEHGVVLGSGEQLRLAVRAALAEWEENHPLEKLTIFGQRSW